MVLVKTWQEYYNQVQKEIALKVREVGPIEYGDVIYESPIVQNMRWLVTVFRGEYNVFVDKMTASGEYERKLGASFGWKNQALAFAKEMFLVCSGCLSRRDRYV